MRRSWNSQIVTIENKGWDAHRAGLKESDNPYGGDRYSGGSLQMQRRRAWCRGFQMAIETNITTSKEPNNE